MNSILEELRKSGTMVAHATEQTPEQFYESVEWKEKRNYIFETKGRVCWVCGCAAEQVDHLLPLKYFPDLALADKNLKPICKQCNKVKGSEYCGGDFRRLPRPVERGSFAVKKNGAPCTPLTAKEVLSRRKV